LLWGLKKNPAGEVMPKGEGGRVKKGFAKRKP